MTGKYWFKILAGMLGVFIVGMIVTTGVKAGITKGKAFVVDNFPTSLQLLQNTGFRVDGDKVGEIQRLQLMRSSPGMFDSAVVTVSVDSPADIDRIASCILRVTEAHPFGSSTRFKCTSHNDSTNLDLVPFGHVVLPNGTNKTFYVASSTIDEMHEHAYRGTGSSDSGDVDIRASEDQFSVTVNGQEVLSMNGDSGSFVVRDRNGKPLVQIHGDSNGGSVRINDGNGKKIVDIQGGPPKGTGKP